MKKLVLAFLISFSMLTACNADPDDQVSDQIKNTEQPLIAEAAVDEATAARLTETNDNIASSRRNAITDAIQKCSPAIVGINVTEVVQVQYRRSFQEDLFYHFFGRRPAPRTKKYEVKGLGSGFIISPDGYILTNHHVAGNASKVVVTMTDGTEHNAEIIGSDMISDVALLKIEGSNFPYLEIGKSDDLMIGEWVIAFGNPFGLFDINSKPTVTVGVVSNQGVSFLHEGRNDTRVYKDMIQTDAAISSGNSGGPLVNALGQVIGMNTMIYSTAQDQKGAGSIGIGFSIPIDRVQKIVKQLKSGEEIKRNFYTGMDVKRIDEVLARHLGLSNKDGVVVYSLKRGSPAIEAGFEPGDVIQSINGRPVLREDDYFIEIADSQVGDVLKFTILRDDKPMQISLEIQEEE